MWAVVVLGDSELLWATCDKPVTGEELEKLLHPRVASWCLVNAPWRRKRRRAEEEDATGEEEKYAFRLRCGHEKRRATRGHHITSATSSCSVLAPALVTT